MAGGVVAPGNLKHAPPTHLPRTHSLTLVLTPSLPYSSLTRPPCPSSCVVVQEPASERLIDLNLEATAHLALFESIFVGIYIIDLHLRTYLQSTRSMVGEGKWE